MIVDSNGRIRFTNDSTTCAALCFDGANCGDWTPDITELYTRYQPVMSVLWTDLVMCSDWDSWGATCGGTMGRITRQIAPVAAPTGEVMTGAVISWEDCGYYQGWGGDVDIQAILYIDGRFSFIYRNLTGNSSWYDSTHGIVGIAGTMMAVGTATNFR
jgi:hypothetical protein